MPDGQSVSCPHTPSFHLSHHNHACLQPVGLHIVSNHATKLNISAHPSERDAQSKEAMPRLYMLSAMPTTVCTCVICCLKYRCGAREEQ